MPRPMTQREIERFLDEPHVVVLTTLASDGRPFSTPIWYLYRDGLFYMRTSRASAKARNLSRDPRVELCVQEERAPYRYVSVQGTAALEPDRPGLRVALARRYLGLLGAFFYLRNTSGDIEQEPECTIVVRPLSLRSEDYSPETPWVGRLWLALNRLLPRWVRRL